LGGDFGRKILHNGFEPIASRSCGESDASDLPNLLHFKGFGGQYKRRTSAIAD
jgi:hypothetical protein